MTIDSNEFLPSPQIMQDSMVTIAVESWRLGKLLDRLLLKFDAVEQNRYQNQFRFFLKKMEDSLQQANLRIINLEGQPFDPGMAATALNIEDFTNEDTLWVEQMLEPVIMGANGIVIKTGTVILRKEEK